MSDADKLLTAYVDGVTELAPAERKRVEALLESQPAARADADATRDLLGTLRELPRTGNEPDWSELEAAIYRQVGDDLPRTPWWRNWRWVVPTAALAAIATVAILLLVIRDDEIQPLAHVTPTPQIEPAPSQVTPGSVVWIDEQAIDLDSVDADRLLEAFDDLDDVEPGDSIASDADGLLPVDDLGWVDALDDKALDRAAMLLEHKKKT